MHKDYFPTRLQIEPTEKIVLFFYYNLTETSTENDYGKLRNGSQQRLSGGPNKSCHI